MSKVVQRNARAFRQGAARARVCADLSVVVTLVLGKSIFRMDTICIQ